MFEFGTVIIAVVALVPLLVFCTPKSIFYRLFPDSIYAINAFRTLVKTKTVGDCHKHYDEKTIKLLTTWNLLYAVEEVKESYGTSSEYVIYTIVFKITKKGTKFAKKYPYNKYGIRFFVIGKFLERVPKFVLPFIGANILFVWYKYFENYLEKLFDMCL